MMTVTFFLLLPVFDLVDDLAPLLSFVVSLGIVSRLGSTANFFFPPPCTKRFIAIVATSSDTVVASCGGGTS